MTTVIGIVSEKGGSGKTTTTVNLAVAAQRAGHRSAILDLDPRANAWSWGKSRGGESKPPPVLITAAPALEDWLENLRNQQAGLVFIDTPGNSIPTAKAVCRHADLVLIPTRPAQLDLLSIGETVQVAKASEKPTYVLINAAHAQGSEVDETRATLEQARVAVCPVVIGNRKSFTSHFNQGLTALELDSRGARQAAQETQALLLWLCQQASLPACQLAGKAA